MKNLACFVGSVFILLLISCDNSVSTADDWQFIPVVYALLDVGESAQYIRLEKAFLDPDRSGLVLAQIPDSLFFGDASVQLREINDRGRIENTLDFFLIDASLEGLEQEEGLFSSTPNYLYKSTIPLNGRSTYDLQIESFDTFEPITSSTAAIGNFQVFSPTDDGILTFEAGEESLILWEVEPDAVIFDVTLRITYREYQISNPNDFETKVIPWTLARDFKPNNVGGRLEIDGLQFLQRLANSIEIDPEVCREILKFDLEIYAGGEDLRLFMEAFFANQNGITGSIPFPRYTNLSSGIGLFSTRFKKEVRNIRLSASGKEQLNTHPLTENLGFPGLGDDCL
ncbi:MAG: hypothetical protein AAF598_21490 [Bacteroidota bacterium]